MISSTQTKRKSFVVVVVVSLHFKSKSKIVLVVLYGPFGSAVSFPLDLSLSRFVCIHFLFLLFVIHCTLACARWNKLVPTEREQTTSNGGTFSSSHASKCLLKYETKQGQV
jgi:hypothetical protein